MVFFVDMNCGAIQGRTLSDENTEQTSGILLAKAILNEEWANPVMDCIPSATSRNPCRKQTNLIRVVHRHGHTLTLEVINIQGRWGRTILGSVHELQLTRPGSNKVCRPVLSWNVKM